ncbi:hypothetical protein DY000_02026481 [Brassica cretica]|uniref:Protein-serine/threonine phosphatase n=1 Tax=Brassica cretica TaxID=69181 RepID=A0ABQ7E9A1_BRACR|nr:hypothetical protein DY000_02026481 [Brassica cretica]
MRSLHPDDSRIVVLKHNVWRVKGIIQISRSIGDVYLKKAEFNREPLYAKYRLREPILERGAVDNGACDPATRSGIARRLVKMALQAAAKKREMRYSQRGVRRHFHDDITVVVIFLDTNVVSSARGPSLSIRGGGMTFPKKLYSHFF